VKCSFNSRRVCSLVAPFAAAFAAPVAQAHHQPVTGHVVVSPRSALVWTASGREVDRLGPKYVQLRHPITQPPNPPPPTVVKVVRPAGFDWVDAGIGAGVAALTLALVAVVAMLVTRRNRRAALPERAGVARV
jgi:hypothetical protein